jgi:hypothetical protein
MKPMPTQKHQEIPHLRQSIIFPESIFFPISNDVFELAYFHACDSRVCFRSGAGEPRVEATPERDNGLGNTWLAKKYRGRPNRPSRPHQLKKIQSKDNAQTNEI